MALPSLYTTKAVPATSAKSRETAAVVANIHPHQEPLTMPDPTHRTATLIYRSGGVEVVLDLPDRPQAAAATVDPATLAVAAVLECGPLRVRFDDPATAALWASAMEVVAAQLRIAADHAAELGQQEARAS